MIFAFGLCSFILGLLLGTKDGDKPLDYASYILVKLGLLFMAISMIIKGIIFSVRYLP